MTGEIARALQNTRPPKGARLLRGVVSQVSPLTVQIAGGAAVAALAVPGTTYTVGAAVIVLWQEPGVGPAYLATSTPVPMPVVPATPTSTNGTFTYSSSTTNWDTGGWQTALTKGLGLGSLTLAARVTTAISSGGLIGTIPSSFGPRMNFTQVATIYSPGWNGATAHLQFSRDADGGQVALDWTSLGSLPVGCLVTCAAGYPLP